jgi:predicted amidohydrolase
MSGRGDLTIAAAQPTTVARDVTTNAAAHAALVTRAGARVVVFPEMSLTGYELDADPVAPEDPRLTSLIDACAAVGTIALVGAMVSGPSIGVLAVDGGGAQVVYRKMWLGSEEERYVVPGTEPAVLAVDGWRLGLAVCKDTGVPEHAAAIAAHGIDVYVAGVLEHAREAHVPQERAQRIATTHDVWVVIGSFAGMTGFGYSRAAGGSGIWSPDGIPVARAGSDVGDVVAATLRDSPI